MGAKSAIEWTDSTWNPVTGCTKISPGCRHCYAERMMQAMGQPNYSKGFDLDLHERCLDLPLRWKKPQNIFVSMSDLFHQRVPDEFIMKTFMGGGGPTCAPTPN
jgi:protein gp37